MNLEAHKKDIEDISAQIALWRQSGQEALPLKLATDLKHSNTIRKNGYKRNGPKIDINKLNRVISIDKKRGVALVEPRVTMEELVKATLPYGLIPEIVPEFKGITVGGAIMGTAIESSSFKYGQFNDTCLSFDIMLGNGSVVHASPTEHPDLFYGVSGSYGSLGIIILAEIKLVPTGQYVEITYRKFNEVAKALTFISQEAQKGTSDYLEAIVYNKSSCIVISGKRQKEKDKPPRKTSALEYSWCPLFYQHVNEQANSLKVGSCYTEYLPIFDYLFRHDRGAFWMGGYARHPWLLTRFLLEKFNIAPQWLKNKKLNTKKYSQNKYLGRIFMALFGWMLTSERLYRSLHSGAESWFSNHFVIQDFFLPEKHTASFINHVLQEFGITPLWICPLLATHKPQILSPHYYNNGEIDRSSTLLFDVGIYGIPKKNQNPAQKITRMLEKLTHAQGGRKMLYGHSFYSPEEFWQIYPKEQYQNLRQRYFAEGVWLDITDKVLAK